MRYLVQVWWGDGWSHGTVYWSRGAAEEAARQLRRENPGCIVRVVRDR